MLQKAQLMVTAHLIRINYQFDLHATVYICALRLVREALKLSIVQFFENGCTELQ